VERDMRISRSRRICLSCGRSLPRAAARCPWCITSIVVPATSADHLPPQRPPSAPVGSHQVML
jgi:predicted amidophosphoribosyltransferase